MYTIEFTPTARDDLRWFRAHEQRLIVENINIQLRHTPTVPTHNRKPLRPNDQASWELRVDVFRILYDVDDTVRIVEIKRIGEKRRNRFFFRGQPEDI